MAFNFFPINYEPVYSLVRTRTYISQYIKLFNEEIRKNLSAIFVDPPLLTPTDSSWSAHKQGVRNITFDNKFTCEVSEIIDNPSNYLRYVSTTFTINDISLFTYMPSIKRDANEGKGEVMITNNYFIEYRLIENNQLKDQVITLAKNIILMINDINKATIFKDIKQPSFIKQKLNVIHIEELIKQFPTLPLRVALIEYINTHGITLVIGACKLLANGRRLEDGLPTADDYDTTAFLYTYDANTKSVLPIIKIATRPTTETIKQQLIMDTPSDLDENIYKDTIMNESIKFPYTIGIQIFFSNLMLVNLNKLHLCEVVASPHSSDLQKYFIDNHIEVM